MVGVVQCGLVYLISVMTRFSSRRTELLEVFQKRGMKGILRVAIFVLLEIFPCGLIGPNQHEMVTGENPYKHSELFKLLQNLGL